MSTDLKKKQQNIISVLKHLEKNLFLGNLKFVHISYFHEIEPRTYLNEDNHFQVAE